MDYETKTYIVNENDLDEPDEDIDDGEDGLLNEGEGEGEETEEEGF